MTGRNSQCDQMDYWAKDLASRGYIAIRFMHLNHLTNERNSKTKSPPNPLYPVDMYKTMINSMRDIQWMIKNHADTLHFVKKPLHSSSELKFAVLGNSMGGHAAQLAFTNTPEIGACVSVVGQGNYTKYQAEKFQNKFSWGTFNDTVTWNHWWNNEKYFKGFPKIKDKTRLSEDVDMYDPSNNLSKLAENSRPFLAINDYDDNTVFANVNTEMFKKIRNLGYYSGSDHSKLHHEITTSSKEHDAQERKYLRKYAVNWLEDYFPVNRQEGLLEAGEYKIVVPDDITSSYTIRKPFLYSSIEGKNSLLAAGWVDDTSWIDNKLVWSVSRSDNENRYTIKNSDTDKFICTLKSDYHERNMAFGPFERISTNMDLKFSSLLCEWKIEEDGDKKGYYRLINAYHGGKLFLSSDPADVDTDDAISLFTFLNHKEALGDWENDLFTFHGLNPRKRTDNPTAAPTSAPTSSPMATPSAAPSLSPIKRVTDSPTVSPASCKNLSKDKCKMQPNCIFGPSKKKICINIEIRENDEFWDVDCSVFTKKVTCLQVKIKSTGKKICKYAKQTNPCKKCRSTIDCPAK
eukprot:CAMPEP_0194278634 /NCGR_PEP_ID=MMETSP0169-20130528/11756_1 /TAXON_ID=218684 /ORGANISM="Corethron pennatum, Strain L29A3" /LENGTH=573 /DNA_ID=CAMNT_0039022867 /DNA_START=296 /DNA_END=2017 /DNA_ORIENTATION=-